MSNKTVNESFRIPEKLKKEFKKNCPRRSGSEVFRKLMNVYLNLIKSGFSYEHFLNNDWKLDPINLESKKDPFLEEVKGILKEESEDREFLKEESVKPSYPFK